jgi:acetyltransferase-like isoleucine patch superfamily enzyme
MWGKLLRALFQDPIKIPLFLLSKLYLIGLSLNRNVKIEGPIVMIGIPLIDLREGGRLFIGKGVTLNSRNKGYHVNMHSPVKLYADRPGAEIRIGDKTRINGACIHAYQSVVIGSRCLIGANCQIFDGSGHDLGFPDVEERIHTEGSSRPIVIEDDVWIGANSIILPGIRIGKGSVIGAGSVLIKNVPPMAVVRGHPGKVVLDYGKLTEDDASLISGGAGGQDSPL